MNFYIEKMLNKNIIFGSLGYSWEKKKLNEIATLNPKCEFPKEFIYIDLDSVKNGVIQSIKLETSKTAPSRAKRLAENNDIFFQTVRTYQKNNLFFKQIDNENYVFSTGYAQIRSKSVFPYFLYLVLHENKFVNKTIVRSTGTSFPSISTKDLGNIKLEIPNNYDEQKKIAEVYRCYSALLNLYKIKITKLKSLKKYLMQNMFI